MQFLPANRLKLYRNFKAIEAQDFHGVVRFYERFEDGVRALDFEEYFDCTLTYTNALFETAQYGKHVVMCDHMLETIIMQNIETWGGEDIYARILYDKSISLYYLQDYPDSEHVLRELVKIYPYNHAYLRLLNKCLLRQKPSWLMTTRALAIALILISSLLLALQLFVIKPFFPAWDHAALVAHYATLGVGLSALLGGEIYHSWHCKHLCKMFAAVVQARRGQM